MATIGDTDHLVTVEASGPPLADGRGGFRYDWTPVTPATWYVQLAPVAPAVPAERLQAPGSIVTHTTYRVRGAWRPGVTVQTRLRAADGRVFHVTSVVNVDERDRDLELLADLEAAVSHE